MKRMMLVLLALVLTAPAVAQDPQPPGPQPYYVLDGLGGLHAGNGAPALWGLPYWGDDVYEELEVTHVRCQEGPEFGPTYVQAVVLDSLGGVWQVTSLPQGPVLWTEAVAYKPYMTAKSLADGDETPFFGFDIARDVEVLVNPHTVWDSSCNF